MLTVPTFKVFIKIVMFCYEAVSYTAFMIVKTGFKHVFTYQSNLCHVKSRIKTNYEVVYYRSVADWVEIFYHENL